LFNIDPQTWLSWLENDWLVIIKVGRQVDRVLGLDEGSKLAVEVLQVVLALDCLLNYCMAPWNTDVIRDSHITFLASANPDLVLILGVDNIKYFLGATTERLENDVVRVWLLYFHDVDDFVVVGYLEGEVLLAQFTV